jgi:tetrahydromethanopterin S-methyltransferase subunit G
MENMTNTQFFVLLLSVLAGVIWQRVDYHQLSGRIEDLRSHVDRANDNLSGRVDRVGDDLKQFYRDLGRHESRLDNIEKKMD